MVEGTKLGPYDVLGLIGTGGMGEVYRARDTRLGRDVAIKTLPSGFAADAERLKRFELEARAASQLSHPNILTIYDIGTANDRPFIVSELLEGENVRERLIRGPLPPRKVVEFGVAIAGALAAAHARGIVHRDLKPENLFLTRDGRVKILDFGIAKLTQADQEQPAGAPTITIMTDVGTAVGTLGYMAPEQMKGQPVDHRADIFALGAVLHEMVAGAPAFRRDSRIATVNAVLESDPPALSDTVAPAIRRIIARCLEKDPDERFQSARDLAFALSALSDTMPVTEAARRTAGAAKIDWRIAALAVLVTAAAVGALTWRVRSNAAMPPRTPKHFLFQPGTPNTGGVTISPDGQRLAFPAGTPTRLLHIKEMDAIEATAVAGTDGAAQPFFSPDGQWVGFTCPGQTEKSESGWRHAGDTLRRARVFGRQLGRRRSDCVQRANAGVDASLRRRRRPRALDNARSVPRGDRPSRPALAPRRQGPLAHAPRGPGGLSGGRTLARHRRATHVDRRRVRRALCGFRSHRVRPRQHALGGAIRPRAPHHHRAFRARCRERVYGQ